MVADSNKNKNVINEALDRFEESQDGSDFNRNAYEDDISFARLADQWPDAIKRQRESEGRPCLTINKLPAFIRQIVNDSRQNKPGIVVNPIDNFADPKTAEVINGLIRSIHRNSNADVAFDTAIDHAVSGGFGFFKIGIDYAHDETFDLEAKIERISNPLSVHWDINSTQFDASDWGHAFISDYVTKDQFKSMYPEAEAVDFEGDNRDQVSYWINDNQVRLAEYYLREEEKHNLVLFSNLEAVRNGLITQDKFNEFTIREASLPRLAKEFFDSSGMYIGEVDEEELVKLYIQANHLTAKQTREVKGSKVVIRVISGKEVLEEKDWPGESIPICPVWGEEVILEGRRWFRSMVRDAIDSQRNYNYWRTATSELISLAPKAPFIGPKGFADGSKQKWATANQRSHAYLEYDGPTPPQRQPFAGVPAGTLQESLSASDDMKSIIGIYDSSLGARSNETSGRAILARQKESDVSNFHFIDNLSRAIQYCGKVLVEIIPHVYKGRQTLRILGEDQKENLIKLAMEGNQAEIDPVTGEPEMLYELEVGKYDVTVKAGPSYASQREETRETLIEIMRQVPGSAQFIGDILLEHMDFDGAEKVAERLRSLVPQPQGANQNPNEINNGQPTQGVVDPNITVPLPMNGRVPQA